MIFRDRKIPKHMIIHDEFDMRKRPRFSYIKVVMVVLAVFVVTYALSVGMMQI